jgi:hypothetical protein
MFEKLCLTPRTNTLWGSQIDPGFLAESLIFYDTVYVAASRGVIRQLIQVCGPEVLVELVERGNLRVLYEHEMCAVRTNNSGSTNELHAPVAVSLVGGEAQNEVPPIFIESLGKEGRGRRLARRFLDRTETIPHFDELIPLVKEDIRDHEYLRGAVEQFLVQYVPEYPRKEPIEFIVDEEGEWFRVRTNMNFEIANRYYHTRIPSQHSSLTSAYLLAHVVNARHAIMLSSRYQTELALDTLQSSLVGSRIEALIRKCEKSGSDRAAFNALVLEEGRTIREVINSGERTFKDLLLVLDEAGKWRKWLKDKPSDAGLIKEYYQAIVKETWADKLPIKTARWSVFTGLGVGIDLLGAGGLGTATGVALSAFDAAIMERILSGWKPHHFVESSLRSFITPRTQEDSSNH